MLRINSLPAPYSIGEIDPSTVAKIIKKVTDADRKRQALLDARPPLDEILNLHDFEVRRSRYHLICASWMLI